MTVLDWQLFNYKDFILQPLTAICYSSSLIISGGKHTELVRHIDVDKQFPVSNFLKKIYYSLSSNSALILILYHLNPDAHSFILKTSSKSSNEIKHDKAWLLILIVINSF